MEDYIQEENIRELTDKEKELELIMNIIKTKNDLQTSMENYEYAEDDLIDYYAYHIKATRAKLDYLVKKAKIQGLKHVI